MKNFWFFRAFLTIFLILIMNSLEAHDQPKRALIFGVTGQDGAYLTEFLLNKNYEVHGVSRQSSLLATTAFCRYFQGRTIPADRFFLHTGDLLNTESIMILIQQIQPDEIYNLAAQSQVKMSFDFPEHTAQIDAIGPLRILEAIRLQGLKSKTKFFQASTSELYGLPLEIPQTEKTVFHPRSPYGVAKLFAHHITVNYREAYGMFACNGILFNHESPLRAESFVSRKITKAACRIKLGLQDALYLGNLDVKRDWGFAQDYVEAMWLILQHDTPDDYVIATGESHSVREFVELAFQELGITIEWHGEGVDEYGKDRETGKTIVKIDPQFYRPIDVNNVLGNSEKAEKVLGWKPKTHFQQLLKIMIEEEFRSQKPEF